MKLDPQLLSEVLCRFITLTTPTHYPVFNSQGPPTRGLSSRLKAAYVNLHYTCLYIPALLVNLM